MAAVSFLAFYNGTVSGNTVITIGGVAFGGSNNLTLVTVFSTSVSPPSSVVSSGIGVNFTLIKSISMGGYNISYWGALGLSSQSGKTVTITFPSACNAGAMVQNFSNVYQGALPNVIQSNDILNGSSVSITFPDVDNLAVISGICFTEHVQGYYGPSIGGEYQSGGGAPGTETDWFTQTGSAPNVITFNHGVSAPNTGISAIVIEESTWVAPIPINVVVCPYFNGGFVRKMVNTLSNLWAITGQAVRIVQDGQLSVDDGQIVNNGQITLTNPGAVIHVGLPYQGTVKLLPLGGDSQEVNQGKERKVYDIVLRVYRSLSGQFGADTLVMKNLPIPAVTQPANAIVDPYYTGDVHGVCFESKWDTYCQPILIQSDPLPFTLLAEIIRSEISEDK